MTSSAAGRARARCAYQALTTSRAVRAGCMSPDNPPHNPPRHPDMETYRGDRPAHDPDMSPCRDGAGRDGAGREGTGLYPGEIASVLVTEKQIRRRIVELAQQVAADFKAEHGNGDLLLVGVLKGAVMFMTDFARALPIPVQLEFMAVSS